MDLMLTQLVFTRIAGSGWKIIKNNGSYKPCNPAAKIDGDRWFEYFKNLFHKAQRLGIQHAASIGPPPRLFKL